MPKLPALALVVLVALLGCQSTQPPPDPVPDGFVLRADDTEGADQDLDAALARGERVVLVFWQTWCPSCEKEAPLIAAAAESHAESLRFVGVVPGSAETVNEAEVASTRVAWGYQGFPLIRDADMSWTRALGVQGTPTIVILGKEREILYKAHQPPSDWTSFRGAAPARESTHASPVDAECQDGVCPLPAASPAEKVER